MTSTHGQLTPGERLWALAPRLRLLAAHLRGSALRRRIENEDLVQEAFLRALGKPESWPPHEPGDGPLYRYMVQITRHCAIDAARALRARKREERSTPLLRGEWSRAGLRESQLLARESGPATQVQAAESRRQLEEAFSALPPEYRRVIGLRQFEGLSAREASERMGRSETAIHSLYRRALVAWSSGSGVTN